MEKVLGIDLDLASNPQWPEIVALKTLRNAIVHEEGWLSTKNETVKKHVKQGWVELRNQEEKNGEISGRIIMHSKYIDHVLAHVRTFFETMKI